MSLNLNELLYMLEESTKISESPDDGTVSISISYMPSFHNDDLAEIMNPVENDV